MRWRVVTALYSPKCLIMRMLSVALSTRACVWVLCFFSLGNTPLQAQDDATLINITSLEQLNAMRYDLNGDGQVDTVANATAYLTAFSTLSCVDTNTCAGYELMDNLDFAGTKWEDPTGGTFSDTHETGGWMPIGDSSNRFTAVFEGNDHTLSNLYINSSVQYVGLFGVLGTGAAVRNVGIEGGSVTTSATGGSNAGGLVGQNDGTISGCYATGTATATGEGGRSGELERKSAGGLVGNNNGGTISGCYATGTVEATEEDGTGGGLVGQNDGTISGCYATGNVTGRHIGGLVGNNNGTISGCYATGTAEAGSNTGGLVGGNGGTISSCYATGTATGHIAGGLVGGNGGTISGSYATATATGGYAAGGLVGYNSHGTISGSYATGTAEATGSLFGSAAGGLVGRNNVGTIASSYATGAADATGDDALAGGLVGFSAGTITSSYATGAADATGNIALAGGLVGYNDGTINDSYFDSDLSGTIQGIGGDASGNRPK